RAIRLQCKYICVTIIFFFQAEDGIRDRTVTGVQACALPIYHKNLHIPKKKSKGKPLTYDDKETNKIISSYRVIVEHAIGGIKRRSEERRVGKECRSGRGRG